MQKKRDKKPIFSRIVGLHYFRLVFRSVLFLAALGIYLYKRILNGSRFDGMVGHPALLAVVWLLFAGEMCMRLFPSRNESMGCQKQFACNYRPSGKDLPRESTAGTTFLVFLSWVLLNGAIGALYFAGIVDRTVLLLVSLLYSVCDSICILFFCPFQTWIMKNKCCTTCRIYNWDYAMMFTPLIFVPSLYGWSLLGLALVVLGKWEWLHFKHPERFLEHTNCSLNCANCEEKLCHCKKQLRGFLRRSYYGFKDANLFRSEREKGKIK